MSQQKPNSLNPGASEFVPNFTVPNMSNLSLDDNASAEASYQQQQSSSNEVKHKPHQHHQHQRYHQNNYNQQGYYQQQQQYGNQGYQYYGQNNNNSHRHSYNPNPNYRGNNYNANHRNKHHHYNNNNNQSHYNGYHYNQQQQQQQGYDVDPIELEARCEAVIEILQDDKIRDQLNSANYPNDGNDERSANRQDSNNNNQNEPQCDDEEEMLEMMAMQEECRLEMMKFYIQSQNPTLFEEIYHDVSYPDSTVKKVPDEELKSPKVPAATSAAESTESEATCNNTLRDLIINELNPDVAEFVPNKFSNDTEQEAESKPSQ